MKKLLYAIAFACLMAVCPSCDKSETENGKDNSYIIGSWAIREEDESLNEIEVYIEFTVNGLAKMYYAGEDYATYKDGTLSYPWEWEFDGVTSYRLIDGVLFLGETGDEDTYEFKRINKDEFSISRMITDSHYRKATAYFLRIKKFSK